MKETKAKRITIKEVKPERAPLRHNFKVSHHRPSRRGRSALLAYEGGPDFGRRY